MKEFAAGLQHPLFFIGVVENKFDPHLQGRVQVRAFGLHGLNKDIPTEDLPWAICVQGGYDPNAIPDENDFVFGVFLDGRDAQQPMVLGLIPTPYMDPIDPEANGWGVRSQESVSTSKSTAPENYGQPQQSRLARGENIEETYVMGQETGRVKEIKIAGDETGTWEEPGTAYNAVYPYNRVIETGKHSIELDDTPGAERIMIRHQSGSFVQIDNQGNHLHKTTGDKYEVNDEHQHVYIGGRQRVTIMGDSYVYVDGNKIEEINGDLQTIVHGNHYLGVGGQSNYNASEQIQMRAGDIKVEANVGTLSIKAAKEMQTEAGIGMYRYAPFIWDQATSNMNVRANNLNMSSVTDLNIRANGGDLNLYGSSDVSMLSGTNLQVESNGNISVTASSTVYINDYVSMAEGGNATATEASYAEESITAATPDMPEPPTKSTSTADSRNTGSRSSAGIAGQDDSVPIGEL
jgi:hypothetical protein